MWKKVVEFRAIWAAWFFFVLFRTWLETNLSPEESVLLREDDALYDWAVPFQALMFRRDYQRNEGDEYFRLKTILQTLNLVDGGFRVDATDARDRVYALLGLANDVVQGSLIPDYTKETVDVYTETTRYLVRQGHLSILSLCRSRVTPGAFPSWVPDWASLNRFPWFERRAQSDEELFSASGTPAEEFDRISTSPIVHVSPHLLTLQAHPLTKIQALGPIWSVPVGTDFDFPLAGDILTCISTYLARSTLYTPAQKAEGLFRVPTADLTISEARVASVLVRAGSDAVHGYELMLENIARPELRAVNRGGHYKKYLAYVETMEKLFDSRPFLSEDGHVGIAPMQAQIGDGVFIIKGARVPYVLRGEKGGMFSLVGEAYVFGAMDGEVFEGESGVRWEDVVLM